MDVRKKSSSSASDLEKEDNAQGDSSSASHLQQPSSEATPDSVQRSFSDSSVGDDIVDAIGSVSLTENQPKAISSGGMASDHLSAEQPSEVHSKSFKKEGTSADEQDSARHTRKIYEKEDVGFRSASEGKSDTKTEERDSDVPLDSPATTSREEELAVSTTTSENKPTDLICYVTDESCTTASFESASSKAIDSDAWTCLNNISKAYTRPDCQGKPSESPSSSESGERIKETVSGREAQELFTAFRKGLVEAHEKILEIKTLPKNAESVGELENIFRLLADMFYALNEQYKRLKNIEVSASPADKPHESASPARLQNVVADLANNFMHDVVQYIAKLINKITERKEELNVPFEIYTHASEVMHLLSRVRKVEKDEDISENDVSSSALGSLSTSGSHSRSSTDPAGKKEAVSVGSEKSGSSAGRSAGLPVVEEDDSFSKEVLRGEPACKEDSARIAEQQGPSRASTGGNVESAQIAEQGASGATPGGNLESARTAEQSEHWRSHTKKSVESARTVQQQGASRAPTIQKKKRARSSGPFWQSKAATSENKESAQTAEQEGALKVRIRFRKKRARSAGHHEPSRTATGENVESARTSGKERTPTRGRSKFRIPDQGTSASSNLGKDVTKGSENPKAEKVGREKPKYSLEAEELAMDMSDGINYPKDVSSLRQYNKIVFGLEERSGKAPASGRSPKKPSQERPSASLVVKDCECEEAGPSTTRESSPDEEKVKCFSLSCLRKGKQ